MRIVALVPIKLNSQRIPNKNTKELDGRPLCWYVPNTLLKIGLIDKVYIYCSSKDVMDYVPCGTTFLERDRKLDENEVKGLDIYKSFAEVIDADLYVLAHTTSPFLKCSSVENALNKIVSKNSQYDSAFSARRFQTFSWFDSKPINYSLTDVPRTQDISPVFIETSGFYIFSRSLLLNNHRRVGFKPFIQEVDEIEGIDIDEPADFEYANTMAKILNLGERK